MSSKNELIERVARRMLADMEDHGGVDDFCDKLLGFPEQYLSELAAGAVAVIAVDAVDKADAWDAVAEKNAALAAERDIANEQTYGLAEEREKWKERAERAEAEAKKLRGALQRLVQLSDDYSPFGGELLQDRVDHTWEFARAALEGGDNADQQAG